MGTFLQLDNNSNSRRATNKKLNKKHKRSLEINQQAQTAPGKHFMKRQRSRYEKPINAMWELFSDYSNTSTIHGVRYLGEKRRHWSERTWWIFSFALSLLVCGKLIIDTWNKWDRFPVMVTFAEKSTPIWEVPFPAVTICPETKAKQTLFNYTRICNDIMEGKLDRIKENRQQWKRFVAILQICRWHPPNAGQFEGNYTSENIFNELTVLAPKLNDIIFKCEWKHQKKSCEKLFSNLWTEEGLCFTFNLLNASDLYKQERLSSNYHVSINNHSLTHWNPTTGYSSKCREQDIYPYRVFGASDGLFVYMGMFDKDIDYLCGGAVQGFKLLLHTTGEIPQISKYFYRIPLDHEVIVSVKPILMTTAKSLENYAPDRRQCFFEKERRLTFFKVYTQRNCELECITNNTVKRCGCASFSMPRDNQTRICGLANMKCYSEVEQKISRRNVVDHYRDCNCLPACSSISYDAELSFAKYDLRKFHRALKKNLTNRSQYARIFISFKDNQFFASRRTELYGRSDFLANCGGLLGLFMGFSLLSFVEMIYYCTLRLACNLRKRSVRKKQRLEQVNETTEIRF